jgi:glycine/D-amino acid oxidase-like deaminating enzyme/nitrite reductase/ring-hydroxylating ferredoxin subunit
MQRDGARTSLWQANMPPYPSTAAIPPTDVMDVLIVGGGITGVTSALLLQLAGKKCVLAEAQTLCFGTSGGTTAHLNTLLDHPYSEIESKFGEKNAQLLGRATREALQLIRSNVQQYQIDCGFEEQKGYMYAQNDDQIKELEDILKASQKAGIIMEYTQEIPIDVPFKKAVSFEGQAKFHPSRYIYSLAKAFEDAGGILLQGCRITKLETNEIIEATSKYGIIKSKNIIWATHIPPGVNLLHFRCAPYRSYAMAIKLKGNAYPNGLIYDMYDPYHYFRSQQIDGEQFFIAGGEDHKTAHEKNTAECFDKLESYLRKYFDIDNIVYKWSSQYFEPADGLPYIGHLPGNPENVFVATGFGGNGMTCGTISAILLSDILTNGRSDYQDLFDPNRLKPIAGFANFVKQQADVVGKMISGHVSAEKITELSEIAHGEARVVKYEDHKLAIYKDEAGNVHAVNPVCPHAKCIVEWNNAEQSWDCPCHGSRFNADGVMLTGPASFDLEEIRLKDLLKEKQSK